MRRWARIIFWAAILLYPLCVMVWLSRDRRVSSGLLGKFSAFNTSDSGLSLALRYVRSRRPGIVTDILTRSIDEDLPANAVVLRVGPSLRPFEQLVQEGFKDDENAKDQSKIQMPLLSSSESEWVYRGGRLVLALNANYGALKIEQVEPAACYVTFPLWQGVTTLFPDPERVLESTSLIGHAILLRGDRVVASRLPLGRGEVIFLSVPEVFQNQFLGKGSNLSLLEALVESRPVFFDETVHGIRSDMGVLGLMRRWSLGPFLLLVVLIFAARFWREGKRLGPAVDDFEERRTESVDVVESLSELYDRGLTRKETLQLYVERFRSSVGTHTRLHGEALDREVVKLLGGEDPKIITSERATVSVSQRQFEQALSVINEGFRRLQSVRHR